VSLPPAVSTTDQCVVTKTGERITPFPCAVVPVAAVGSEVLTEAEPSRTPSDRKRSGPSIPSPQPNLREAARKCLNDGMTATLEQTQADLREIGCELLRTTGSHHQLNDRRRHSNAAEPIV
jgi:hypothetical protein